MNLFTACDVQARNASFFEGWVLSRNGLYTLVGVLIVVVIAIGGYLLYEQSQKPKLEIKVDGNGIQVNGNG